MLAPIIKRASLSTPQREKERGVTMALVAISIVAIISFAALAIDLGTLYEAKAEAQRSADAAALAAAQVISTSGLTGDPTNSDGNWAAICGGTTSLASVGASTVAQQDLVGGVALLPANIKVNYGTDLGVSAGATDCTAVGGSFGINPVVSVYVQQPTLPTFFAHVFSVIGGPFTNSGVSATAYAEAFNASNSNGGVPIPVQPRCVKPIIIPNEDPQHVLPCSLATCTTFVNKGTGQITSPGMFSGTSKGVIGERFFLYPDCNNTPTCTLANPTPYVQPTPLALQFVPGDASAVTPVAIPTSGGTCGDLKTSWAQDVAGCDESTVYQCGVQNANTVNLNENPLTGDAQAAIQCLINQSDTDIKNASGQDTIGTFQAAPPLYPFQMMAGTSNPLTTAGISSGSIITTSPSIVSLPIYDQTQTLSAGATNVTIIGFLQVFINGVSINFGGSNNQGIDVTVLNVIGCGNAASNTTPAVHGTSPVPVRLIAPPS
jgi:Flp pilus assembly protein TadG